MLIFSKRKECILNMKKVFLSLILFSVFFVGNALFIGNAQWVDILPSFISLLLSIFLVVLIMPFVQRWLDTRQEKREKNFTLDDVKNLIEENNAKLLERFEQKNFSTQGK